MIYHKDTKIYLNYDYKDQGFKVDKNFADGDSLEDYITNEYRNNNIIVVDNKQNKILINTQDIARLRQGGHLPSSTAFFTSPKLPFYITSLISSFGTFDNYLEEVSLQDISKHFSTFNTPKNSPFLSHLVYPIYGKVVTTTPDRVIIQTSQDKISVKRTKDIPFSLNDVVCIGVIYAKHKLHYACLFCNVTQQTTEFEDGDLSILQIKFKDALY